MTSSFTSTKKPKNLYALAAKQEPPGKIQEAFGCDFSKSLRQIRIDEKIRNELAKEDTSEWSGWYLKMWIFKKRVEYNYGG